MDHEVENEINKMKQQIRDFEEELIHQKRIVHDAFSFRIDHSKPEWWNEIKINLGELSWEQVCFLERTIRSFISNDLSKQINNAFTYSKTDGPVEELNKIVNLINRISATKSSAYQRYNAQKEEEFAKKRKNKQ